MFARQLVLVLVLVLMLMLMLMVTWLVRTTRALDTVDPALSRETSPRILSDVDEMMMLGKK